MADKWFLWKEIKAEGDLESKITSGKPSSPKEMPSHLWQILLLNRKVYASIKEEMDKEYPDGDGLIVVASTNTTHYHRVFIVPQGIENLNQEEFQKQVGVALGIGSYVCPRQKSGDGYTLLTPFFFK